MLNRKNALWWAALASALFIAADAILTAKGSLLFNLVPLALMVVMLAVTRLDAIYFLIVFFTPLSIQLKYLVPDLGADLSIPTEPLMIGVLLLLLLREISGRHLDRSIMLHPVSLSIYFILSWMLVTSVTSSLPLVSFKYLFSRIWFLATFYFLAAHVFRKKENIVRSWWLYLIPFTGVVIYTLSRHVGFHFTQMTAHFMMKPFYNDHTSYGAMLAMYLPVLAGLAVLYFRRDSLLKNTLTWLIIALFIFALIFSYTRAAWISILGALGLFILLVFRIRMSVIITGFLALLLLFFAFRTTILMRMEDNKQDSSSNFTKHIQSISNIATDASNLERINRWHSALRMFAERPVFGYGPGTYQFNYAPFQLPSEKTIISTNFGTRGNAHSEYLGPLSESGVPGMAGILLLLAVTVYTGIKVYLRAHERKVKILSMTALLGLVTYFIHGALNNFLDTDKASAPFWGFIAAIVALDLFYRDPKEEAKDADSSR